MGLFDDMHQAQRSPIAGSKGGGGLHGDLSASAEVVADKNAVELLHDMSPVFLSWS